ncbi:MAG TPA: hypothetical protein VF773_10945 [Verrucomicrobiae bacterium]
MPASAIAEFILAPIFEFIFHVLGYYIGRVVLWVFTLGRIKCDRILTETPRRKLRAAGTYHRRGDQIYLTAEATAAVGIIFVAVVVGCGLLLYFRVFSF